MSAPLVYLPRVDSTNTWARDHMNELAPFGAVYTTCQTAMVRPDPELAKRLRVK